MATETTYRNNPEIEAAEQELKEALTHFRKQLTDYKDYGKDLTDQLKAYRKRRNKWLLPN